MSATGPVTTVTLNRPERRNALTPAFWAELCAAIEALDSDEQVRAIVLTGAGTSFCAGFDLHEIAEEDEALRTARLRTPRPLRGMLPERRTPVIAAVNGPAVTGGLELALSCDLICASLSARFADTHAKVGALPGGGATILLPRRIGPGRARLLSLTGQFIDAELAHLWGLADELCADDALLERAVAIGDAIAQLDEGAIAAIREQYDRFENRSDRAAFAEEQAAARAWMAGRFDRGRLGEQASTIISQGRSS